MSKILFVDDEKSIRLLLKRVFENDYEVAEADSCDAAMAKLAKEKFDLVVTDVNMPEKNGIDLLNAVKGLYPHILVILITGYPDVDTATKAVRNGAFDYIKKPFKISDVQVVIERAVEKASSFEKEDELAKLEKEYIGNLEVQLTDKEKEIQQAYEFLNDSHIKSLEMLARAADYRDDNTGQHIIRIGRYSEIIAKNLRLPKSDIEKIKRAAPMHDIGKVGIPDNILQKPGKLTKEEFDVIKTHTSIGANIFKGSTHPLHVASGIIALTHHEKYNGKGYPRGIAGENIHLYGRIVAVVDVFDALLSERPYKKPWPLEKVIELIKSDRGEHFDPVIVDCFLSSLKEILQVKDEMDAMEKKSLE